jgi:hypothetical protein
MQNSKPPIILGFASILCIVLAVGFEVLAQPTDISIGQLQTDPHPITAPDYPTGPTIIPLPNQRVILVDGVQRFLNQHADLFLDLDGENGGVILGQDISSGTRWQLINQGDGLITLQNLGNSRFKDYYLDINGETGEVILSPKLSSGTYWLLSQEGGGLTLKNQGNSRFKNYYLDIDGSTDKVILSELLYSGAIWK